MTYRIFHFPQLSLFNILNSKMYNNLILMYMKRGRLHIGYWETYSFHFSCEGLAVELVAIISRRVGQSKLQEVKWPLNILIIAERQPLHKYYPFGSAMAPCFTNI